MTELVKVTRGGQITIPAEARRELGIVMGDYIEVRLEQGRLVLTPKALIDKDQTWFWTESWQAGEKEADADLRSGNTETFDTLEEVFADLDSDESEV